MIKIHNGIYVGDEGDCKRFNSSTPNLAVVHACKFPCHRRVAGVVDADSPHYLSVERGRSLYLNLIDPSVPLFKLESFSTALAFMSGHWHNHVEILIHCNQGLSRAPSLALLFLAGELGELPTGSYAAAAAEFRKLYPQYAPGLGIQTFLREQWATLIAQ